LQTPATIAAVRMNELTDLFIVDSLR